MGTLAQNTFKTPEQIVIERQRQQQAMYAAAQSPYERMGLAVGNILGQAFGVKDPELERASLTQSIYNDTLNLNPDINSSNFYTALAKNLSAAGLGAEANYSLQEAKKFKREETADQRAERQVALQEERLNLDKRNLDVTLEREKRQGLLTDAQIRQINAQIANMGSNYEYQVIKNVSGEPTAIVAINKKNPSDVKQIPLINSAPPPAAAGNDMSAQAKAELERRRNAK